MYYHVQWIKFLGRTVPIVLQQVNGPCPLLAVCNVLFLKGQLNLKAGTEMVSFEDLCANLTAYLQRSVQDIVLKGTDENRIASALQNLEEVVALLPKLEQGLDINVRFTDPLAMEFTSALALFDLCNIRLVHGWCYDQQDIETKRVIGTMSYNELVSWIMMEALSIDPAAAAPKSAPSSSVAVGASAIPVPSSSSSSSSSVPVPSSDATVLPDSGEPSIDASLTPSDPALTPAPSADAALPSEEVSSEAPASSPSAAVVAASSNELPPAAPVLSDDEKSARLAQQLSDRNVARSFLDSSPSQLTIAGLASLHEVMKEDELAVLFRNNHFSVLYKRNTGRLYTLITDAGIISSAPYVVWSYQSTTEGDHLFLDHDWKIPHPQTVAYYASLPNNRLSVPLAQPQHHNHSPIPQASPVTPSLPPNSPNPQGSALNPVMATPISDPSAPPMPADGAMAQQVPMAIPISHAQPVQPSGGVASSSAFAASPSAAETLAANRKFAAENGLIWNEVTQNFEQLPPPPQQQQQHYQPYMQQQQQQQNPQAYRQPVHVSDRMSRPGEKEKKKKDSCVVQ